LIIWSLLSVVICVQVYLIQIELIDVLPKLFETIFVPRAVHDELVHADAPAAVRAWIAQVPAWLEVRPNPGAVLPVDGGLSAALGVHRQQALELPVANGQARQSPR